MLPVNDPPFVIVRILEPAKVIVPAPERLPIVFETLLRSNVAAELISKGEVEARPVADADSSVPCKIEVVPE